MEIRKKVEDKQLEKVEKLKKLLNGYRKPSNFQKIDVYLLKGIFDKDPATFDLKFEMNGNQGLSESEQNQPLSPKVSVVLPHSIYSLNPLESLRSQMIFK